MKGKYIPFLALPIFFLAFLLLSPLSVDAKPKEKDNTEVIAEVWKDTSLCIPSVCGTTLGTKTQALYEEVCEWNCPIIKFSWTERTYMNCPVGYQTHRDDWCKNGSDVIDREFEDETIEVNVQYIKSQDPNKCHRPSDSELENVYGMSREVRSDFKDQNAQSMDAVEECKDVLIDTRIMECSDAIPFACEEEEEDEEEEKEEGDVLGEKDEQEVLGTSVVMAKTGGSSNLFVYIIQSLLSLSTLASGVVFAKRYIM